LSHAGVRGDNVSATMLFGIAFANTSRAFS
jgi:hypothetical protein